MGIRFACPECHDSLNIKLDLAGRRSKCPRCGSRFRIPLKDQPFADPLSDASLRPEQNTSPKLERGTAQTAASMLPNPEPANGGVATLSVPLPALPPVPTEDPLLELPTASWYVRPQTGGQYGPAAADIMRQWLGENRIGATALVWREGWTMWRNAAEVFPQLANTTTAPPTTGFSSPSQKVGGPDFSTSHERGLLTDRKRLLAKRRAMTLAILAGVSVLLVLVLLGILFLR